MTILERLSQLIPAMKRQRLRARHRQLVLQRTIRHIRRHDEYVPLSDQAVSDLLYGWGSDWSLREALITELWHRAWKKGNESRLPSAAQTSSGPC